MENANIFHVLLTNLHLNMLLVNDSMFCSILC